jgi:outer membrane protein OmpA-like peptidoglycan-associated protein
VKNFLILAFASMPMWTFGPLLMLAACSKKPKPASPYPPKEFHAPEQDDALAAADPNEAILDLEAPTWSLFFDFDSYNLKEIHKAAAVAQYLIKTGSGVFLAGYASEEGPTEYNLALGAQRALTVRNYLEAAGVPVDRLTWQSYGEEKPVTQDPEKKHLNRRVEIIIERKTP